MSNFQSPTSISDRVGQLMMIGFDGTTVTPELRDVIARLSIGGIILFERNVESPEQLAQLCADLQMVARENNLPPLFISIDQEGGVVARLKEPRGFTEFPSAMAVAATGDVENARRVGRAMARELRAVGINMDLTPVLDVNNNPRNPIISTRSYGSDPGRVAEFGVAMMDGLQSEGVIAIGKHFPGHGDTGVDSHISLPTVPHDRARLESIEFVPFRAAMQANIAGIMSAHVTFPAIDPTPALAGTLSPRVLTDLLRGEMQYDGLAMTDELTMGAIATSGYPGPRAAITTLKAGADILLFNKGFDIHRDVHRAVVDAVTNGDVPEARLNDAVRRVMRLKAQFKIGTDDRRPAIDVVGSSENKTLSRAIAAQAVTLVRDPANNLAKVAQPSQGLLVVETGAYNLGKTMNATTMTIGAQPTRSEINAVLSVASDGRVVIVATSDVAKNSAQADLVRALVNAKSPVIVVATRSPYDFIALPDAVTYLAIYGANPPMIEAVADVLTGKSNARGKLPVEFA